MSGQPAGGDAGWDGAVVPVWGPSGTLRVCFARSTPITTDTSRNVSGELRYLPFGETSLEWPVLNIFPGPYKQELRAFRQLQIHCWSRLPKRFREHWLFQRLQRKSGPQQRTENLTQRTPVKLHFHLPIGGGPAIRQQAGLKITFRVEHQMIYE